MCIRDRSIIALNFVLTIPEDFAEPLPLKSFLEPKSKSTLGKAVASKPPSSPNPTSLSLPVDFSALFEASDDSCLLYTSDAADERSSVDLGGRRIIKKKKIKVIDGHTTSSKNKNNDKLYPIKGMTREQELN